VRWARVGSFTVGARQRIVDTAYDLFSRHSVRAVGIDRIVAEAGVAKMSLYRHFPTKDALVLAVLQEREQRWTRDWLGAEVISRASTPQGRLLAIFDVFGEWFQSGDFEGDSFVKMLLEFDDPASPVRQASLEQLANVRSFVCELAEEAGVRDPDALAHKWHILMKGAIVTASAGDARAAERAREMGELLLTAEGANP
jgi:AcrR family transcriptional regulator